MRLVLDEEDAVAEGQGPTRHPRRPGACRRPLGSGLEFWVRGHLGLVESMTLLKRNNDTGKNLVSLLNVNKGFDSI